MREQVKQCRYVVGSSSLTDIDFCISIKICTVEPLHKGHPDLSIQDTACCLCLNYTTVPTMYIELCTTR